MRRFLLIAPALCVSATVFASSFASFTGGRGDGYAHGDFITPREASAVMHFLGGPRDGYAHGDFITLRQASAAVHFLGGPRDGYGSSGWRTYQPATVRARFAGNAYDGHASSRMLSSWWQTKPKRFFGGGFDGYDQRASFAIPNWVLGDTDGNSLPDWWELKYFGVLTGTPPQGDADHDGASNVAEYLSGTNPTNADSYFHIVGLTLGSPTKILATCEPGKSYTLLYADSVDTNWAAVTGQVRIPSSVEGMLELDDSSSATNRFYRVRLEY
jgi:hypothetical protein